MIDPSRQTWTGQVLRTPAQFAYMAYDCQHLVQSSLQAIADFHSLASLQAFVSTIAQPDGYPDAMSLHVAISQPD